MPNDQDSTESPELRPPELYKKLDVFYIDMGDGSGRRMLSFNPDDVPDYQGLKLVIRDSNIEALPDNLPENVIAIEIINCPNFQKIGDQSKSKLEEICIESCPKLTEEIGEYPDTLTRMTVKKCDNFNDKLDNLPGTFRELFVKSCSEFNQPLDNLPICLISLGVEDCRKLKSLPKRLPLNLENIYFTSSGSLMFSWFFDPEGKERYEKMNRLHNYNLVPSSDSIDLKLSHTPLLYAAVIDEINKNMVKVYKRLYPDTRYSPSLNDPQKYAVLHLFHRYIYEDLILNGSELRESFLELQQIAEAMSQDLRLLKFLEKIASEYNQSTNPRDFVKGIVRSRRNATSESLGKLTLHARCTTFTLPSEFTAVIEKDSHGVLRRTFDPAIIPNDDPLHLIIQGNDTIQTLPHNLPSNVKSVKIKNCPALQRLGISNSNIEELNIKYCDELNFDSDELPATFKKLCVSDSSKFNPKFNKLLPRFQLLCVIRCENFNPKLNALPEDFKELTFLECHNFNQSVSRLPNNMKLIRLLYCNQFNQSIAYMPWGLQALQLYGLPELDDVPIFLPPNVSVLSFTDCPKILYDKDRMKQIEKWSGLYGMRFVLTSFNVHLSITKDINFVTERDKIYSKVGNVYKRVFEEENEGLICYPSVNNKTGFCLFRVMHRYITEHIHKRGDKQEILDEAKEIADFLEENPHFLKHFEKIAEIYDRECVNQPVFAMIKILNCVKMAKQDGLEKALESAKALVFADAVHAGVLTLRIRGRKANGRRGWVGVGAGLQAEAVNVMLYKVSEELVIRGVLDKPFPGTPKNVMFAGTVKKFTTDKKVKKVAEIVERELQDPKNIANSMCNNTEYSGILAYQIMSKKEIDKIWDPHAEAQREFYEKPEPTPEDANKPSKVAQECQNTLGERVTLAIYIIAGIKLPPHLQKLQASQDATRNAKSRKNTDTAPLASEDPATDVFEWQDVIQNNKAKESDSDQDLGR